MPSSKSVVTKTQDGIKRPSSIHKLIESTLDAHVKDIKLYTEGHLNFGRFTKPSAFKGKYPLKWKSIYEKEQKETSGPVAGSRKRLEMMSDALFDFSLGSSGVIPADKSLSDDPTFVSPIHASQEQKELEDSVMRKLERQWLSNEIQLKFSDPVPQATSTRAPSPPKPGKKVLSYFKPHPSSKVCVEELKLPELMLTPLNSVDGLPPSLRAKKESSNQYERKKFITTHLAGITYKDQFHKMADFNENILQKSELLDRNLYDGHKAVAHLENKLVGKLLLLQMKNLPAGPSFEKLQVYSEVWDDLVLDSSIFGALLKEIKNEYDNFLSHLLELVKLNDHDEILRSYHVIDDVIAASRSRIAENLFQKVDDLEVACRNALLKNYTLRENIDETLRRIDEDRRMKEEEQKEGSNRLVPRRRKGLYASSLAAIAAGRFSKSVKVSKETALKNYRADIWKQIDKIEEMKRELREKFVPKTLHRNVLHAIKDLEIELQKFYSQEAYLTQHIKDSTDYMNNAFGIENISEEDERKIWDLITNENPSLEV